MKTFSIFAGVNGAGKSTFYKALGHDYGIRINLDEIIKAQFNGEWDNPKAQMAAGRIAVKMIKNCIAGNDSFNQETTFAKTIWAILSPLEMEKSSSPKFIRITPISPR